jgi:hypothetical protein
MREDSMGLITEVRVRQPANDDLVGRRFEVAGIRSGLEATIGMRLLRPKGRVIGTGSAQRLAVEGPADGMMSRKG